MDFFKETKNIINKDIDDKLLTLLVFDISRYFDKKFTLNLQKLQKNNNKVYNLSDRQKIRKEFYYSSSNLVTIKYNIESLSYTKEDVECVFKDFYSRLETYDQEKIIESLAERLENIKNDNNSDMHMEDWFNYFNKKNHSLYSNVTIRINQDIFKECNYDEKIITNHIINTYKDLENYRHLALVVQGEIFDKNDENITWKLIYKASIFAENFVQYEEKYNPFKKEKHISELEDFLVSRNIPNKDYARTYYTNISTGYKFEDCYISEEQKYKIILFKKIVLDNSNVPCPSCNTTIQSGNSFPELFLRSWECKNPTCPTRSKSGRGKRFDEYGVLRYFKVVENDPLNIVDEEVYKNWRRDIYDSKNHWLELIVNEYLFTEETILIINNDNNNINLRGRKVVSTYKKNIEKLLYIESFDELPIVKLFKNINNEIILNDDYKITQINERLTILNGDSTRLIPSLDIELGAAITSPPYYNAREYSQWQTLITYFVDVLRNTKAIYNKLKKDGFYIYNIGDIVSEDNVYVKSLMSKRRIQLGFLSSMIFEIVGFNLAGNIIWDKGQVQSKRNSTINLVSGYVKCINCYEHVLVYKKGNSKETYNSILSINPVIKINSKGENTVKHTAPYPKELVDVVKHFSDKNDYILDPYLGSGTTLLWCKENGYKGIGCELNDEYYELCKKNIEGEI